MDLSPYVDGLRRDLAASAAVAGDDVAHAADLLAGALEASARLTLLEALSDAAAEVTAALDDVMVDVRLRGRDADLVITSVEHPPAPPPAAHPGGDPEGDMARITLRLPEAIKAKVEAAANAEGISVNAWLTRAVTAGLAPTPASQPPLLPRRGRRITGYAQA